MRIYVLLVLFLWRTVINTLFIQLFCLIRINLVHLLSMLQIILKSLLSPIEYKDSVHLTSQRARTMETGINFVHHVDRNF